VELDHLLFAVDDLEASAAAIEERYGLTSVEGGRHRGWGTENRIVPLGDAYIELVTVVDEQEAAASAFGTWVASARDDAPLGWAVRTDDLDAVTRRLRLTVTQGSRPLPGGRMLTWRLAGLEHAASDPSLPFFIEWSSDSLFPGRARPPLNVDRQVTRVELSGDPARIASWLGEHTLPIALRAGRPEVTAVALGDVVIRGTAEACRPGSASGRRVHARAQREPDSAARHTGHR